MKSQTVATVVDAPGKVNWTLDVLSKRLDGYHEITSIMQRIELADTVTVQHATSGIALEVKGPEAWDIPCDDSNIAYKAAKLLGIDGVMITIEKNLPSQAGLGGGSSDGASSLVALNKHFNLDLSREELMMIARKLGADVSFFLYEGACRVTGFGDIVQPVPSIQPIDLVLVKPPVGVSTVAAYAALDRIAGRKSNCGTAAWPLHGPSNDFEEAVFALYPEVGDAAKALRDAGAAGTLLCGSGATVMGWGGNVKEICATLRMSGYEKVWITRTVD